MKWFPSFRPRVPESRGEPGQNGSLVQPSLALGVLCNQLRSDRKYQLLDLGPACGANIDFFSRFRCSIRVEDLYQTLTSFDYLSPEDGFNYEAVFRYLMPYKKSTLFDIVLSWDLFNYLDRDELQYLMAHLFQFCHSGTVLFAMISTHKLIPDKPGLYKIIDAGNLAYDSRSDVLRPCPRYHDNDLKQFMPGFRVYNSFLLRNGTKEYLLVCH